MRLFSYSRTRPVFIAFTTTTLPLILISFACGRRDAAPASGTTSASTTPSKAVRVGRTELRQLTQTVVAPGTLAADEQATVSFKVAGRLEQINVDLGSSVRRGQTLAQLETNDFKVRLQQAEAALQQARVRLGLSAIGDDDRKHRHCSSGGGCA